MKNVYLSSLFNIVFHSSYSQIIQTGSYRVQLGIEADMRSHYTTYRTVPSFNITDHWFATSTVKGVIDTTNAALYKSHLKNNNNISFAQRMSITVYAGILSRERGKTMRRFIMQ